MAAPHAPAAVVPHTAAAWSLAHRVDQAAAVFAFCWHVAVWKSCAPALTPWQHAQFAAALAMVLLVTSLLGTGLWVRRRSLLIALPRLAFALLPARSSTRIGPASALRYAATPGHVGAVKDAARVLVGAQVPCPAWD